MISDRRSGTVLLTRSLAYTHQRSHVDTLEF